MNRSRLLTVLLLGMLLFSTAALADTFQGTLYYTRYNGGQNVWSINFNYNDSTNVVQLTNNTNIASVFGADGIIFAPSGNLLIGGQNANRIHEITTTGTFVSDTLLADQSYHLALDPNGTKVYTSNFMGPLSVAGLTGGHLDGTQTLNPVTPSSGSDRGVTQLAFAPNGNVFYVNGNPNGGGDIGLFNLGAFTTNELFAGINPAHGLIYDPFSGLMTMFGAGYTGTFDVNGNNLKQSGKLACDFDQGAVDGFGHALVAGCGQITFIDYSGSGDITAPNFIQSFNGPTDTSFPNFAFIDDVAPLVGPGSQQVPEPASLMMLGSGLVGFASFMRKRLKK